MSVLRVRKKEPSLLNLKTPAHTINIDLGGGGGEARAYDHSEMAVFKSRPGKGMCLFMLFKGALCVGVAKIHPITCVCSVFMQYMLYISIVQFGTKSNSL